MPEPVESEARAEPLCDHVDELILGIPGYAGDERHSHGFAEKGAHTTEELGVRAVTVPCGVLVDHMAECQRIEK